MTEGKVPSACWGEESLLVPIPILLNAEDLMVENWDFSMRFMVMVMVMVMVWRCVSEAEVVLL